MSPVGRPEIGPAINIRLGYALMREVDTYAEEQGLKRAEAIRDLVRRGLEDDLRRTVTPET